MSTLSSQKVEEEAKRDRNYDPALRWQHIQDAITWAEANIPEHLRRNRPRQPKWQPEGPVAQPSPLSSNSPSSQPR